MSVQLNIPVNSKVKSVTGAGNFTNEYGTFNSWEYTMEDGMVLKANHKDTTDPFAEGNEIEYTITKIHPEHGNSGKVGRQQNPPHVNTTGVTTMPAEPSPTTSKPLLDKDDSILYQVSMKMSIAALSEMYNPSFTNTAITAQGINDLALEIAQGAKENIQKL